MLPFGRSSNNSLFFVRSYDDTFALLLRSKAEAQRQQHSPQPIPTRSHNEDQQSSESLTPNSQSSSWSPSSISSANEDDDLRSVDERASGPVPTLLAPGGMPSSSAEVDSKEILSGEEIVDVQMMSSTTITTSSTTTTTTSRPVTTTFRNENFRSRASELSQQQSGDARPNLKQLFLKYLVEKAAATQADQQQQSNQISSPSRSQSPSNRESRQNYQQNSASSSRDDTDNEDRQQNYSNRDLWMASSGIVPRNLSSPSARIAQLFADLNQENGRISRFHLPVPVQPRTNSGAIGRKGGCGDVVSITNNYELQSPNYPDKYPPNMDCVWEIRAEGNQNLRVQIFKLNLEQDKYCRFDYLDIKGESLDLIFLEVYNFIIRTL